MKFCPVRGINYARSLLSRRKPLSDSETHVLARSLRSLSLDLEARVVEAARGTWWLRHHHNAVKAAYFYRLSGDTARLEGLLERSLNRCMVALAACDDFVMVPMEPSPPSIIGSAWYHDTDKNALKKSGLQSVAASAKANELEAAAKDASDMLLALGEDFVGSNKPASCLQSYVNTIRARTAMASLESLKEAGASICRLVLAPVAPMRYEIFIFGSFFFAVYFKIMYTYFIYITF